MTSNAELAAAALELPAFHNETGTGETKVPAFRKEMPAAETEAGAGTRPTIRPASAEPVRKPKS